MIYYPIQTLVKAGIEEVMLVIGGPHAGDFIRVLKNGQDFGIKHIEYSYQETGDGGIADALSLARDFADGGPIAAILGDNCTDADITKEVVKFKGGATVFLKKVTDPERFGIVEFDPTDKTKIISIVEKPEKPKSDMAVTGVYIYDAEVFDHIEKIKPSARGQLEITDVNNLYVKEDRLNWAELDGYWSDAGTFDSLYRTGVYWARKTLNDKEEKELTTF